MKTVIQAEEKEIIPSVIHALPGRVRFRLYQLTNENYAAKLENLLKGDRHVNQVRINRAAASIVIYYHSPNLSEQETYFYLGNLIQKAAILETVEEKYPPLAKGEVEEVNTTETESDEGEWSSLRLPALATILAMVSNSWQFPLLRGIATILVAAAALPVAQRGLKSLFVDRKLNIDCLDLLALSLSGLQGKLATPALVITLHELGDIIREQTARSTEIKTADLLDAIGHFAWVERNGEIIQIPSNLVQQGETVIVYPGEQIPVDGEVLQGKAVIDQAQLTGESMPIVGEVGDLVYASTLVRSGQLQIQAERVGVKTRAAASIELLQKAPVYDTRMANYAAKLADQLIVPSLVLAGIVLATTRDPARAASILTLDFVTGIRVSMPTAFLGALNHTTRHGVLVRSGRTLELLAEVDTIVFDKTGTLTEGDVRVVGVDTVEGRLPPEKVLQLAASAEQRITHPVAEAIAHYAATQGIDLLPRSDFDYELGLGMRAEIEGHQVLVGNAKFLHRAGVNLDCFYDYHPCIQEICDLERKCPHKEWLSLVYVACDGEFQGVIKYTDPIRPEAANLINKLRHDLGMEIHLLTGDNETRAQKVASELNIPPAQVHAEAFPEQKATIVRNLHRCGKTVAFVGDGLNDSVALAYADVSVSFENGSDIARETADVVLMNDNLASLLEAFAIAKETKHLIEQNTVLVVGPNLIALGLASTIGLNPLIATVVHNGSAIAAGLNSLRPLVQHEFSQK